VVSVITKSGTNQFHGSLFEFNRNTDFNANSWAPAHNAAGKIIVAPTTATSLAAPWAADKEERCVFLLQLCGLRQVTATIYTGAITPTANERLGDFTADTFKVYMPGTSKTVLANGVNAGRVARLI